MSQGLLRSPWAIFSHPGADSTAKGDGEGERRSDFVGNRRTYRRAAKLGVCWFDLLVNAYSGSRVQTVGSKIPDRRMFRLRKH